MFFGRALFIKRSVYENENLLCVKKLFIEIKIIMFRIMKFRIKEVIYVSCGPIEKFVLSADKWQTKGVYVLCGSS